MMLVSNTKLVLGDVCIEVEHRCDILVKSLNILYAHAIGASSSIGKPEFRIIISKSDEKLHLPAGAPDLEMEADKKIYGYIRNDRFELTDGRTSGWIDYEWRAGEIVLHKKDDAAIFVAIHRIFLIFAKKRRLSYDLRRF